MIKQSFLSFSDVLKKVVEACKDGASARETCELGDKTILDETSKIYKKDKEIKKGKSNQLIHLLSSC